MSKTKLIKIACFINIKDAIIFKKLAKTGNVLACDMNDELKITQGLSFWNVNIVVQQNETFSDNEQ